MGKVFTWEEIEKGSVPSTKSFLKIEQKIRSDLQSAEGVIGAVLLGSMLHRRCDCRSDVDCLLLYNHQQHCEVMKTLQAIGQSAQKFSVPLEFIPIGDDVAERGLHTIKPSFAWHVRHAIQQGGLIKKNPSPSILLQSIASVEDVREYLRFKIQYFTKFISSLGVSDENYVYEGLKKVLEIAVHVARKKLWLSGVDMPDDSKREVLSRYPAISKGSELKLFLKLTAADEAYTKELRHQLECKNKGRYVCRIQQIAELGSDALEFVKLAAFGLS